MSFIADTQTKLDTVARKIERADSSAARRLFRLSAAVGRAPNSMYDSWAAHDIHQLIGINAITEQVRAKDIPNRTLRFIEFIRNLLIFIPLAVTWFGIYSALSSYYAFVIDPKTDKTQLQQPFLFLWQGGFGGKLPNGLILGNLALYDFILLSGLVVLTAIVNYRTHLRSSLKEQEAELLQEELTDALADAALCLTRTSYGGPGGGGSGIDISPQLEHLQEAVERDTSSRDKAMLDMQALISPIAPVIQEMVEGSKHIYRSMNTLKKSLDTLTQDIQSLSAPMVKISDAQKVLLDNVTLLLKEQRDASQAVKLMVDDQKVWGKSLQDAIQEFSTTNKNLNELPIAINQWTAQLEALVAQLRIEHQAQTTVTQETADVATRLQMALDQVQDAANNLRSMSKDYFDVMNIMQAFPGEVNSSIIELTSNFKQSGDHIMQASQTLINAANRLNGNNGH